jgi:maltoporin
MHINRIKNSTSIVKLHVAATGHHPQVISNTKKYKQQYINNNLYDTSLAHSTSWHKCTTGTRLLRSHGMASDVCMDVLHIMQTMDFSL